MSRPDHHTAAAKQRDGREEHIAAVKDNVAELKAEVAALGEVGLVSDKRQGVVSSQWDRDDSK